MSEDASIKKFMFVNRKAPYGTIYALEGLEVPQENMLGEPGAGYRIALAYLENGRIGVAAQAVGVADPRMGGVLAGVLAGGGAVDDPEGGTVLGEVRQAAAGDADIHVLDLPPWSALEINALQRASTIVIQKSLREGFGLTVTEALWKKKPVVASAVGGIPTQVIHKHTGMLAHSVEGTAYQIRFLLSNPAIAQKLGEQGHEHVRENFLITSNIKRYLTMFLHLLGHS